MRASLTARDWCLIGRTTAGTCPLQPSPWRCWRASAFWLEGSSCSAAKACREGISAHFFIVHRWNISVGKMHTCIKTAIETTENGIKRHNFG